MFNLHRLGLILMIGGSITIGASVIASAGERVARSTSFVTLPPAAELENPVVQGHLESADQLLRHWWPRSDFMRYWWSYPRSNDGPLATLPTATATPSSTRESSPTAVPPTAVPPTQVPPTAVPPTQVPPTAVPPTQVPPTAVPPTQAPALPTNTPQPAATLVPTAVPTTAPTLVGEVMLGGGDGSFDSGTRALTNGQSIKVSCKLNTLTVSKATTRSWGFSCEGQWDDDRVTISCASPAVLTDTSVSSLSRVAACGSGATAPTSSPPTLAPTTAPQAPTAPSASTATRTPTAVPTATRTPTPVPATPTPSGGTQTVSGCIVASTPGQVIQNVIIRNCGNIGIDVVANNVTIRNVTLEGNGTNIRFHQVSGGVVENSILRNPNGSGYVQQIGVDKSSGITIRNNTLTCSGSGCRQEDAIGVYQSSNITITGNSISGGLSDSGCGIMADAGASRLTAIANTIRNQVNCGIGIANGTDHMVDGNDVAIYGNVGIYVWNQYGGTCSRITVRNNTVAGGNPWWDGGNCSSLTVTGNTWN